jgi:Cd(II)/Pb(II)-responsive transcriptional regulator
MMPLTIGALAQHMQCQPETIRYYEREGLLPPPARSSGNYRLYDKPHLERLGFIRRCRSLDMTLDEIRVLLHLRDNPAENCREVTTVLDAHIQHVADRIVDLRTLKRQLRGLRRLCAQEQDGCGILKELARGTDAPPTPAAARHIRGSHSQRPAR